MSALLDPWSDAQSIAQRLAVPGARLVALLGAEAWCEKCRVMRPLFEAMAVQAASNETWLWLDLEDHAEFIGDFLPDDLPWLLVYRGKALVASTAVTADGDGLAQALVGSVGGASGPDAGLLARLVQPDWAS